MNWVEGLLADSAEIINEEGALPNGYYKHVRLQDDRNCSALRRPFSGVLLNWEQVKRNLLLISQNQRK